MGRSCEVEMLLRWLGVLLVGTVAATAGGGEGVGWWEGEEARVGEGSTAGSGRGWPEGTGEVRAAEGCGIPA